MAASYDFIVVGAGASGSVLASRLSRASSSPSVLLLEAGGENSSSEIVNAGRFVNAFAPGSRLNWGYKTVPQKQLVGQEIDYSRGKGLGGTTAINFCGWVVGPSEDYDEWARVVGDEAFGWDNVRNCLRKIGKLHPDIPDPLLQRFVNPQPEDHSVQGVIDLTYGESWLPDVGKIYMAAEEIGLPMNPDVNAGNPIGMGMGTVCIHNGRRLTAANTYLHNPPPNLTILTESAVAKVIFVGKRAVGVQTVDGRRFHARKEVVLSGGAINSPQILLLSGVGPRDELRKHEIELVQELAMVGQNLQDHCFSAVGITLKRTVDTPADGLIQSPTPMGWFKLPSVLSSPEYDKLGQSMKNFLCKPTIPSYEIATHTPSTFLSYEVPENVQFVGAISIVMNPQSRGTVTLRSPDPSDAPLIDPRFLTHPYDQRVVIEGTRQTLRLLSAPVYAKDTVKTVGPENDSDEAILKHARETCSSSWHMAGTVCMGENGHAACVDRDFLVFGLQGLRVIDLAVCPFVPNNHTQSTAYVLGEIGAQKLISEYNLDREGQRP